MDITPFSSLQIGTLASCRRRVRLFAWITFLVALANCLPASSQVLTSGVPKTANGAAAPIGPINTQSTAASQTKRIVTLNDAVSLFLQQNLNLVAARYDIDTVDAEKLSAGVRPNPSITVGTSGIPLKFNGPFFLQQTFAYNISQDLELGGKREKRITAAEANSELARAQFQMVVWQVTNDVKKKFYTVLLNQALLNLARENQKTFADIVDRTTQVFKAGEISGLDLQRLQIEKFKFDTDLANSERDYELALRDLRLVLGGDYRAMDIEVAGAADYYQSYQFSLADLQTKAFGARPDLKAAQVAERAAEASIRLQEAQKIPNLTVSAGVNQDFVGGSNYNFGVGITLPVSDRNQTERAKAQIEKKKAQNQQQLLTNQIASEVDKALVAVDLQKRRVELYRTGVLTKVNDIQTSTEFALKAGENSVLDLLDAIRTRRDTLAGFYQTIFDYQSALLDLELATATPLP